MLQAVSCLMQANPTFTFGNFLLGAILMCEALTMSINGKIRGGGSPTPSESEVASRWIQNSNANEAPRAKALNFAPLEIKFSVVFYSAAGARKENMLSALVIPS